MKYLKHLIESLVGIFIAGVVLYFLAWLLNEPAGNLVGWMALGMAASASAGQK
jgi:hypothetical protein